MLMKDLESIKKNNLNVVSTFSGCGGSSLGYKMSGYNVLWANEFIPSAQECYKANFSDTFLNTKDIRLITPEEILKQINYNNIDILDGSPPCASFSMSGKRDKLWGQEKQYSESKQRVDDLFFEYIRLIKGLRPKVFIAENVEGLNIGIAKTVLGQNQFDMFNDQKDTILYKMRDLGYRVDFRIINSVHFGLPQTRKRLFIIGVRNDLNKNPIFPLINDNRINTLSDAIKEIKNTDEELKESMVNEKYQVYKYLIRLKPGESGSDIHENGSYFNLKRLEWNKPCGTILQMEGRPSVACGHIHPDENRKLTIRELKKLQGFPDDFILTGNYQQKWERIGRSVCPPVMKAISKRIETEILN